MQLGQCGCTKQCRCLGRVGLHPATLQHGLPGRHASTVIKALTGFHGGTAGKAGHRQAWVVVGPDPRRSAAQGLLCGVLQVIVQRLSEADTNKAAVLQYADAMMEARLGV